MTARFSVYIVLVLKCSLGTSFLFAYHNVYFDVSRIYYKYPGVHHSVSEDSIIYQFIQVFLKVLPVFYDWC